MNVQALVRSARPPFLLLTPICVLLGASTLYAQGYRPETLSLVLALLGGLSAHISVNTFNEYFDFKSGLDLLTHKTPFSGGSGSLPESPTATNQVLALAIISLLTTALIGIYFVWKVGPGLLPFGLAGLLLAVIYTRWINRRPLLCLIAPGAGFGILMVVGTQIALGGEHSPTTWTVAILPFFLTNNLLLLNQYPDIRADTQVGRHHFPIAYGVSASNLVYVASVALAGLLVIIAILLDVLPMLALVALLPLPLALFAWVGARRYGEAIAEHPRYLAANVATALLSPALLAIGMAF